MSSIHDTSRQRSAAVLVLALSAGLAAGTAGRAGADAQSTALLERARAAAGAAKTLRATLQFRIEADGPPSGYNAQVRLMKPNLAEIRITSLDGQPGQIRHSDGKSTYTVSESQKQYQIQPTAPRAQNLSTTGAAPSPLGFFFAPDQFRIPGELRAAGKKSIGGVSYEVVEGHGPGEGEVRRLYFGPSGLLEGSEIQSGGPLPLKMTAWLKGLRLNEAMTPESFSYNPPPGYTSPQLTTAEDLLLPVGSRAPDFLLEQLGGGQYGLSQALQANRAALVLFWTSECPACRDELKRLAALYPELRKRGVEVVAVNGGESAETAARFLQDQAYPFRAVLGGTGMDYALGKAYRVSQYPTNYLVAADGKIFWRGTILSDVNLRRALDAAGLK